MKKITIALAIALAVVWGMVLFLNHNKKRSGEASNQQIEHSDEVRVTFLDVGQGDATFIEFPSGEQLLVDCSEDARILEVLGRVMPYYDRDIDYVFVTHPDSDHYGGCQDVLDRFDVGHVVYTGFEKEHDSRWNEFLWSVENKDSEYIEINKEDVWTIGSSTLHFLYPDHTLAYNSGIPGEEKEVNNNNTSIVFKLDYGESSLLMMGDAEEELEEYLMATYGEQLNADIIKLGHHGSDSSSIQEFIDVVSPDDAIVSAGLNNKFGHPSRRVLKRLERASSTVWRTDLQGDIHMIMNMNGHKVSID